MHIVLRIVNKKGDHVTLYEMVTKDDGLTVTTESGFEIAKNSIRFEKSFYWFIMEV